MERGAEQNASNKRRAEEGKGKGKGKRPRRGRIRGGLKRREPLQRLK